MKQDEIIKALRKVVEENTHYTTWTVSTPHLVLLVNLAIEQEREACEALCKWRTGVQQVDAAIDTCAAAIRARGEA
jgi:hypothetical protein